MQQVQLVDVKLIQPDPNNPRKHYPKEGIEELAGSIKALGVQQPLRVVKDGKGYRVVFGHRRLKALELLGVPQAPVLVDELDELGVAERQLEENLQREDLAPLEVAAGYRRLKKLGQSVEQICERFGRKKSTVYAYMQLEQLPKQAKDLLASGHLIPSVAMRLTRIPESRQLEALERVADDYSPPMTDDEAARQLEDFDLNVFEAPFDNADSTLNPAAGPCVGGNKTVCPKIQAEAKCAYCLDPACWEKKRLANVERLKARAKTEQMKVLEGSEADDAIRKTGEHWGASRNVEVARLSSSVKKALDEAKVKKTLAIGDEAAKELVSADEARAALKAAKLAVPDELKASTSALGGTPRSEPRQRDPGEVRRDRDHKIRARTAKLAIAAFAEAKTVKTGGDDFIRALMLGFVGSIQQEPKKLLCKELGIEYEAAHDAENLLLKHAEKLKGAELRGFVMQLACAEGLQIFHWGSGYKDSFESAAEWLGVNLGKLKTQATAELSKKPKKVKPKDKPAPAPKKVTKLKTKRVPHKKVTKKVKAIAKAAKKKAA